MLELPSSNYGTTTSSRPSARPTTELDIVSPDARAPENDTSALSSLRAASAGIDFPDRGMEGLRWIEDAGLLRDEGITYGMSGLEDCPSSKEQCIRHYYGEWIAHCDSRRSALREEIEILQRRWDRLSSDLRDLRAREQTLWDEFARFSTAAVLRAAVGLLLAVGAAGLGYQLILHHLPPGFQFPEAVAIGIVMAGTFLVFQPVSLLYTTDAEARDGGRVELWKIRLLEYGLPTMAALFVATWSPVKQSLLQRLVLFLFLSLLLLLSGKLALSLFSRLGEACRPLHGWLRRKRSLKATEAEIAEAEQERQALEERQLELHRMVHEVIASATLEEACELKVQLFRSEFELGRATRRALPQVALGVANRRHS